MHQNDDLANKSKSHSEKYKRKLKDQNQQIEILGQIINEQTLNIKDQESYYKDQQKAAETNFNNLKIVINDLNAVNE